MVQHGQFRRSITRSSWLQLASGCRPVCLALRKEGGRGMETFKLTVNGQQKDVTVDPSTPLLWVLREDLKMTGTKYGCGIAACGACTIHLGGVPTRSCAVPVSLVGERPVVTIEAMSNDTIGRVVQDAWVENDVV